jgi:hypothetical protein
MNEQILEDSRQGLCYKYEYVSLLTTSNMDPKSFVDDYTGLPEAITVSQR